MLIDFVASGPGVLLMSIMLGVGVGLMTKSDSVASWVGSLLITGVVVLGAATFWSNTPWAAPVYALALGLTSLLGIVRRYSDSPLLDGEPYWRKVALTLVHARAIRRAALVHREGRASAAREAPHA